MECDFTIVMPEVGRQISDDSWRIIEPIHIAAWEAFAKDFQHFEVKFKGDTYRYIGDFSAAIQRLRHGYEMLIRIYDYEYQPKSGDWSHDPLIFTIHCESDSKSPTNYTAEQILNYLIHEAYIYLNLTALGCCDLHGAKLLELPPKLNVFGAEIQTEVDLRGRIFETTIYEQNDHDWLRSSWPSYEQCKTWVRRCCPDFGMLPENPSAKCIFALQHIGKSEYSPASVIWIFYALESLFQCKSGENFRTLIDRISLFLELSDKSSAKLKKKLRELYDSRSSFVHGGLQIVHPMQDDGLDKRAGDASWKYVVETDFGVAILIKCIHKLIELDWKYPVFSENISGEPI